MANKDNDRLKQGLLLAFVIVGILLIGFTWADGLSGTNSSQPGYVRPSLSRMTPAASEAAPPETAPPTPGTGEQTGPSGAQATPGSGESPEITPTIGIVDEDQ